MFKPSPAVPDNEMGCTERLDDDVGLRVALLPLVLGPSTLRGSGPQRLGWRTKSVALCVLISDTSSTDSFEEGWKKEGNECVLSDLCERYFNVIAIVWRFRKTSLFNSTVLLLPQ